MTDGAIILETLALVADRQGDPADAIYAELFSQHPQLEPLFWLDSDGGVRASMVQQALECVLDRAEGGWGARAVVTAARQHHHGYGVPPESFDEFFVAMRSAFRGILGVEWTAERDRAWVGLLADFAAMR